MGICLFFSKSLLLTSFSDEYKIPTFYNKDTGGQIPGKKLHFGIIFYITKTNDGTLEQRKSA